MDPCCGSGHFLVEAFSMLWQMRAEEEGFTPVEAQDAVLRDNLFGLELDPRCVQIAMFAVALQAWKDGGGWRQLPVPNIACSGIPVKAPVEEWKALAGGDQRLENALVRLHILFRDADTLGSLVDPKAATESNDRTRIQTSLSDVAWEEVVPLLAKVAPHGSRDPASQVLGADAAATARATELLTSRYSLVATNVPYLARSKQGEELRRVAERHYPEAKADLATVFLERCRGLVVTGGTDATVTPQNWLFLGSYSKLREGLLTTSTWDFLARIGLGATSTKSWDTLRALVIATRTRPSPRHQVAAIDAFTADDTGRSTDLRFGIVRSFIQSTQLDNPAAIITTTERAASEQLSQFAVSPQGIKTGDDARHRRVFWELPAIRDPWRRFQSTVGTTKHFDGCESIVRWEGDGTNLARPQGQSVWNRSGVAVSLMRALPVARYEGDAFDSNMGVLVPKDPADLAAIWAFASSDEFNAKVREVDPGLRVVNASLLRVAFDVDRWRRVADEAGPLPAPWSDDPKQWLFGGRPDVSTSPLQVAVGRLVGFRWPDQAESDDLDSSADADGIVCLPSVAGEPPAAERVQQVLAAALGQGWTPAVVKEFLEQAGSKKKNLADWLRDEFFKQHCALFGNRPFVWHIWDGQRDGFSALVNYHRLDRKTLEKLTYTYLGQDWVERQQAEVRDEVAGAEARLSAALGLQRKLEAILEGDAPYDIYVRWKEHARAADRVGARPERWCATQHPSVCGGRGAARPVQYSLAQGPRQEPRRLGARERQAPHACRQARRTQAAGRA